MSISRLAIFKEVNTVYHTIARAFLPFFYSAICFFLCFFPSFCPFSIVFVLYLWSRWELCKCSSDISLSSRPGRYRIGNRVLYCILLDIVEARSVNVKNTHTHTYTHMMTSVRRHRGAAFSGFTIYQFLCVSLFPQPLLIYTSTNQYYIGTGM